MGPQIFGRRQAQPTWLEAQDGHLRPVKRARCCRRRPPLPFCLAWSSFCLLLAFGYLMSLPVLPKASRFIGYQAFERVTKTAALQHDASNTHPQSEASSDQDSTEPPSSTILQITNSPGPAYPLDIYAPLVHNPVPLSDITVQACIPLMLSRCKPFTTPDLDTRLGPWVRVDRPLDSVTAETRSKAMSSGWAVPGSDIFGKIAAAFETNFIFYRRSRRSDAPRVVELKIRERDRYGKYPDGEDMTGWHLASQPLRSNKLLFKSSASKRQLLYRTVGGTVDDFGSATNSSLDNDPITEIDVIYGPGPMWPGFEAVGEVEPADEATKSAKVTLAARRKPQALPELPVEPRFKQDGTFTVMQLADLHYSVLHGPCRDVAWETKVKPCVGDTDTIKLINQWLDEEKPDLVVFSGDQLNGQTTSWDERSVIPKWVQPVIDRKIPWASIQGNHDSQSGVLTRREQQLMLATLPYSYTRAGPAHLHDGVGAGNFYLKLKSPTPDAMHLFTLYFMDSGAYAPIDLWHPLKFAGYDWIRQDQRLWFEQVSDNIKNITRPYLPDGAKDLGKLWNRASVPGREGTVDENRESGGLSLPTKGDGTWSTGDQSHLSKPKAIIYTHIPVPEMADIPDKDAQGQPLQFGSRRETVDVEGAQKERGIFLDVLLRNGGRVFGADAEVVAFMHGHMHNNVDCQRTNNIWICFNGGSSFAGYGDRQLERRTRLIRLSQWGEQVETWSRLEQTKGRVEEHVLYSEAKGKAAM